MKKHKIVIARTRCSGAHSPVNIELNVVRTPVEWFSADLVMLPATGMDPMNEAKMLHIPNAIISCDASTTFPPPGAQRVAHEQDTNHCYYLVVDEFEHSRRFLRLITELRSQTSYVIRNHEVT